MKNKTENTNNNKALLVTTAHKGVFFGYGTPTTESTIRLERARMCVYWTVECRGVLGLAVTGPTANCKIGPAVPSIILREVTSITEVSDEAIAQWEKAPWK